MLAQKPKGSAWGMTATARRIRTTAGAAGDRPIQRDLDKGGPQMSLSKLASSGLGLWREVSEGGSSLPLFLPLARQRVVVRRDEQRQGNPVI